MDKQEDNYLTSSQLTLILLGSMIGIGALTLPLGVIKNAKQSGWIACIFGAVYPIYFTFMAQYMHKKFPDQNILMLSKKYCGKFLGNILNLIFVLYFLLIVTEVAAGINNILIIYMVSFLTKYKILIALLLPPAYVSYKGIKTIARMNEVIFYLTLVIFFIPIAAIKEGNFINMTPIFGGGIINIIKATKETILSYSGIEILLAIYPFFRDNSKIKKCGITSISIAGGIYVWLTFITIYYLGIDIIPKFLWPVVAVAEAINIPVINSFRYIFMSLWTMIMFRVLSDFYYAFTFGLSQLITSVNRKSLVILTYPLIFYLATRYGNPTMRRAFLDKIIPLYAIYNVIYVFIVAVLIKIKKGGNCKEKTQQ